MKHVQKAFAERFAVNFWFATPENAGSLSKRADHR